MVNVGRYNTLKVVKEVDFGMYLDGGTDDILLRKRYVPEGLKIDDDITIFIYHDKDGRLIATTAKPYAAVGEIAMMEVADVNSAGAFVFLHPVSSALNFDKGQAGQALVLSPLADLLFVLEPTEEALSTKSETSTKS